MRPSWWKCNSRIIWLETSHLHMNGHPNRRCWQLQRKLDNFSIFSGKKRCSFAYQLKMGGSTWQVNEANKISRKSISKVAACRRCLRWICIRRRHLQILSGKLEIETRDPAVSHKQVAEHLSVTRRIFVLCTAAGNVIVHWLISMGCPLPNRVYGF